jgi:hypothetical protein
MSGFVLKLAEEHRDLLKKEIETKVGSQLSDLESVESEIKKLSRKSGGTTGTTAPATPDAVLVEAVDKLSKDGAVKASDIASHLGVDSRSIARRLSNFAKDGVLGGDKESGYITGEGLPAAA